MAYAIGLPPKGLGMVIDMLQDKGLAQYATYLWRQKA